MANPLKWFRKHQKGMLVVFGVLLMASFGLAGVVQSLTPRSSGGGSDSRDVVKWKGGTLTNVDLANMRYRHFETMQFLNALRNASINRKGDSFQNRIRSPIPPINANGASPEEVDRETLRRFLLAQKAEEMGIVVGDDAVYDYLMLWADDDQLSRTDLENVARETFNGRVDFLNIKNQLKIELAVRHLLQITQFGLPPTPSITEAWNLYKKMNRSADCSVLEFPVEDALSQVTGSPNNSELKALFAEGQYNYPDPTHEEPGFKKRRRVAVSHMSANYDDFLQREMATITPESVKEEYDRLVAEENSLIMELVPQDTQPNDDPGQQPTPADTDDSDPPPPVEGPGDADAAKGADDQGDQNDGGQADDKENSAQDAAKSDANQQNAGDDGQKGDEGQQKEDESSSDSKDDQTGNGQESDSGDGQTGLMPSATYVSTTVVPQDSQEKSEEQENQKEEQQSDAAKQESEGQSAENSDQQSGAQEDGAQEDGAQEDGAQEDGAQEDGAQEDGAQEDSAQEEQDPTGSQEQTSEAEGAKTGEPQAAEPQPADDQLEIDEQQPPTPQRRVRELDDDLAEQIKRRLASAPAQRKLEDAINDALTDVEEYANDYSDWQATRDLPADERVSKPEPLDFAEVAARYKLNYGTTDGLLDFFALSEDEFGETTMAIEVTNFMTGRSDLRPVTVAQLIFQNFYDLEIYRANDIYNEYLSLNQHIFFVTDKQDPVVPEFEDAREDIVEFWRMKKAAEIARTNAQAVADEVNRQGKPLVELYPEAARNTGEFSWFTFQLTYPTLPGVETPGEEFMKTVFGLELDQAGVAPNATGEAFYVIQKLKGDERTIEDLRDQFFNAVSTSRQGVPFGVGDLFQSQLRSVYQDYLQQLEDDAEVRWIAY